MLVAAIVTIAMLSGSYFYLKSRKLITVNNQVDIKISAGSPEKVKSYFEIYGRDLKPFGVTSLTIATANERQKNISNFTSKLSPDKNIYVYSYNYTIKNNTLELVLNFDRQAIDQDQLDERFLETQIEFMAIKAAEGILRPELSIEESFEKARQAMTQLSGQEYTPLVRVEL